MNFLEETKKAIIESNHIFDDVMFIGSSDGKYRLNWDKFVLISNFEYDNGYGGTEIPYDLIIYFNDNTYIIREEYDGSEWWEYRVKKVFHKDDISKEFYFVEDDMWGYKIEEVIK